MTAIRTFGVPSAVASVDLFFGVQEKDHERQIVVEFEEVQICIVDAGQANPDEVVGDVLDALQTDNLPVKFMARCSRHAANDHHERLAAAPRQGFALLEIEDPAMLMGTLVSTSGLSQQRCIGQSDNRKGQEDDAHRHEQSPSTRSGPDSC
jgi:hypothetical protein